MLIVNLSYGMHTKTDDSYVGKRHMCSSCDVMEKREM